MRYKLIIILLTLNFKIFAGFPGCLKVKNASLNNAKVSTVRFIRTSRLHTKDENENIVQLILQATGTSSAYKNSRSQKIQHVEYNTGFGGYGKYSYENGIHTLNTHTFVTSKEDLTNVYLLRRKFIYPNGKRKLASRKISKIGYIHNRRVYFYDTNNYRFKYRRSFCGNGLIITRYEMSDSVYLSLLH